MDKIWAKNSPFVAQVCSFCAAGFEKPAAQAIIL